MSALVTARGLALAKRLAPLDLELRAGELACLIGPNGSGKTSLLHAVAGIGSPSGEVRIDGTDPWRVGPRLAARARRTRPVGHARGWCLHRQRLAGALTSGKSLAQ